MTHIVSLQHCKRKMHKNCLRSHCQPIQLEGCYNFRLKTTFHSDSTKEILQNYQCQVQKLQPLNTNLTQQTNNSVVCLLNFPPNLSQCSIDAPGQKNGTKKKYAEKLSQISVTALIPRSKPIIWCIIFHEAIYNDKAVLVTRGLKEKCSSKFLFEATTLPTPSILFYMRDRNTSKKN